MRTISFFKLRVLARHVGNVAQEAAARKKRSGEIGVHRTPPLLERHRVHRRLVSNPNTGVDDESVEA
jgi:hypothetical protein